MPRVIEPGSFRTRRDGLIVARQGVRDSIYEITKPGCPSRVQFYRDEVGCWVVDRWENDVCVSRAFVHSQAEAERVGALSMHGEKTGIVWYCMKHVITDDNTAGGVFWTCGKGDKDVRRRKVQNAAI